MRRDTAGLYELICHPGEDDADTRRRYSHWRYRWVEELEASDRARNAGGSKGTGNCTDLVRAGVWT